MHFTYSAHGDPQTTYHWLIRTGHVVGYFVAMAILTGVCPEWAQRR